MSRSDAQVALVVGGASGIGEATVNSLVAQGWRVAIGDRDVESAKRVAEQLTERGADAVAVSMDVTSAESVNTAVQQAAGTWGQLDAIVPCAGVIDPSPSDQVSDASLLRMIDVHLMGTIRCLRAAFPFLQRSERPSAVAVSSIVAHIGVPQRLSYAAAKGGIEAVVRTLAVEWAGFGIRVNAVAPGWVSTPMIRRAVDEGRLDVTTLEQLSPFGRMAEPSEIGDAIAFLLSSGAGFITGTTLMIDGATSIKGPWPQGVEPHVRGANPNEARKEKS